MRTALNSDFTVDALREPQEMYSNRVAVDAGERNTGIVGGGGSVGQGTHLSSYWQRVSTDGYRPSTAGKIIG